MSSIELRVAIFNRGTDELDQFCDNIVRKLSFRKMRLDNRARSAFVAQEVAHINQWRARNGQLPVESYSPMAGYAPLTRQACFLVPLRDVHALHNEPQAK
jgi:hypothetical protein